MPNMHVVTIDLQKKRATLSDGTVLPITNMYDAAGRPTPDCRLARGIEITRGQCDWIALNLDAHADLIVSS